MSSRSLEKSITNRKTTTDNAKVSWLNMRWIRLEKGLPTVLKYKTTHQEDVAFLQIDITKRSRGRPGKFGNICLDILFPNGRQLQKEKVENLQELLRYIPPVYHEFYINLKCDDSAVEDNGLFGENSDED